MCGDWAERAAAHAGKAGRLSQMIDQSLAHDLADCALLLDLTCARATQTMNCTLLVPALPEELLHLALVARAKDQFSAHQLRAVLREPLWPATQR